MYKRALFLFRRDLRLDDNSALSAACSDAESVTPLFVIDPALTSHWQDARFRMTFLARSLHHLGLDVRAQGGQLGILTGNPVNVVGQLMQEHKFDAVYINRDYSPFALKRDRSLRDLCQRSGTAFHSFADQLINEPEDVNKKDGSPYTVFTPYYRNASSLRRVDNPVAASHLPLSNRLPNTLNESTLASYLAGDLPAHQSGRTGALTALENLANMNDYTTLREIPGANGSSGLSCHLRFGTCSVREAYHAAEKYLREPGPFQRQLYWRDFYHHIGYHFPHVYKGAFRTRYDTIHWDENNAALEAWRTGATGFPIIDAGMRELATTGDMHNRVRMVVASFLTKNLHIHWQAGEAHFARLLVDFDPAVNNGNWQWAASTGCDAQPYFRVFNPWRQQQRFDKNCEYIKRWIPELNAYTPTEIHKLETRGDFYLRQITNLKISSAESKRRFKVV
jgi:deoxyribodipyrimidine photo-lyase